MNDFLNSDFQEINDLIETLQTLTLRNFNLITPEQKHLNKIEVENITKRIIYKFTNINMLFGKPDNLPF